GKPLSKRQASSLGRRGGGPKAAGGWGVCGLPGGGGRRAGRPRRGRGGPAGGGGALGGLGWAGGRRFGGPGGPVAGEPPPPPPAPFVVREYAHVHTPSQGGDRTDFAETVYWHPVLVLPRDGTTVSFDLSDAVTRYRVLTAAHTAHRP